MKSLIASKVKFFVALASPVSVPGTISVNAGVAVAYVLIFAIVISFLQS
jgi:hypothetical protein